MFKVKELRSYIDLLSGKVSSLMICCAAVAVLFGFVEMFFAFSLQNFLAYNDLIPKQEGPVFLRAYLHHAMLLLLVAVLLRGGVYFLKCILSFFAYEYFGFEKRDLLLRHVFERGIDDPLSVAEVNHVLTNLINKSSSFITSLASLFSAVFTVLTIFTGLFILSRPLTVVAVGVSVILIVPTVFLRKTFQRYSAAFHDYSRRFVFVFVRNVRNLYYLRMLGMLGHEGSYLKDKSRKMLQSYLNYTVRITASQAWPIVGGVLLVILIIKINNRHEWLQPGMIVMFAYMLARLSINVSEFLSALGQVQFGFPFFKELAANIYELKAKWSFGDSDGDKKIEPKSLEVEHLSIGREAVLADHLSFGVRSGDFLLVKGESGKGKTTLLLTLIGLLEPKSGKIKWNGYDVKDVCFDHFRNFIGYAGSDPFLIDATIEDNLLYGIRDKERARGNIAEILHLTCSEFVDDMPGQLQYRLKEAGDGISAGQKQRIALSRALLQEPGLMLLDEATANIDEETESKIFKAVKQKYPDMMIIAVSHRDSIKKFATKVIKI